MATMYRLDRKNAHTNNPYLPLGTMRKPSNVPFIVDNLWEWSRPKDMPSRRLSVYASPTPELARELGGAANGEIFTVHAECAKIVQIPYRDAKFCPEADSSSRLFLGRIVANMFNQQWIDSPMHQKMPEALLWSPCLTQSEVEEIMGRSNHLVQRIDEIRNSIQFWKNAAVQNPNENWTFEDGEIFFEAKSWRLERYFA
jgi:hypothetical protein